MKNEKKGLPSEHIISWLQRTGIENAQMNLFLRVVAVDYTILNENAGCFSTAIALLVSIKAVLVHIARITSRFEATVSRICLVDWPYLPRFIVHADEKASKQVVVLEGADARVQLVVDYQAGLVL